MRKTLLALATGSMAIAGTTATADTGPLLYGKANVSYENVDDGNSDRWELNSNASRLGVKGDLDLDIDQLKAIYQAEFEIAFDDGDTGGGETFSQRNIFGGFQHERFGTLKAGRFDSPLKVSQGDVDQLNDLADIKNLMAGENRVSDIIQYSSPTLGEHLNAHVAFSPGEENENAGTNDLDDGPADTISSALIFDDGTFYGALAYDSNIEDELIADQTVDPAGANGDSRIDILRATGQVRINNLELGGILQQAEDSNGAGEETSYLVSAGYSIDRVTLKAQYGLTDADSVNNEVTLLGLGADYRVGDQSKVFGYFQDLEPDNASGATDSEDTRFGVGFEHKFAMN